MWILSLAFEMIWEALYLHLSNITINIVRGVKCSERGGHEVVLALIIMERWGTFGQNSDAQE